MNIDEEALMDMKGSLLEVVRERDEARGMVKTLIAALSVALHYTEAEYDHDGERELIGCRVALADARRDFSWGSNDG